MSALCGKQNVTFGFSRNRADVENCFIFVLKQQSKLIANREKKVKKISRSKSIQFRKELRNFFVHTFLD